MYKFENCLFTSRPFTSSKRGDEGLEYTIDMPYGNVLIKIPMDGLTWQENGFFLKNKYIFEGLLLNNDWFDDTNHLITIDRLRELLSKKNYPKTPKEKADNLFLELFKMQREDGVTVNVAGAIVEERCSELYFKSIDEMFFYSKYLDELGLISAEFSGKSLYKFAITFKGLNYGIQLQNEGDKSNLCFIAMSFNPDTQYIRNAIKEALWETGFKEILMDEIDLPSDSTINDQIIANLRKCRFCIADFTHQSKGVYFESGFALGQGKKVIYTCLKEHFDNAHFDIKPLQHIIYEKAEQLKVELKHKIEAWVI